MREEEGEQGRKIIKCERQKKIKALPERSKENDFKPFADLYRQMHSEAYQASMIYAENNNIASLHLHFSAKKVKKI